MTPHTKLLLTEEIILNGNIDLYNNILGILPQLPNQIVHYFFGLIRPNFFPVYH